MFAPRLTALLILYSSKLFVYVLHAFHSLADKLLEFQGVDSDTTILGIVFNFAVAFKLRRSDSGIDSISIVGFFIELSRYPIASHISAVIITRFLKVIQFILLLYVKSTHSEDMSPQ